MEYAAEGRQQRFTKNRALEPFGLEDISTANNSLAG